jgi:hypothetical protein
VQRPDLASEEEEALQREQDQQDEMARAEGFEDAEAALRFYGLEGDGDVPFAIARRMQVEEKRQKTLWSLFRGSLKSDERPLHEPKPGEIKADPERAAARVVDDLRRDRPHLLGSALAREFDDYGKVSLLGQQVRTYRDLARLSQVFRNPAFETFRIFFARAGRIAWQTGITARRPGTTPIYVGMSGAPWKEVARLFRETVAGATEIEGVDGWWILHNRPSGDPTPSAADLAATQELAPLISVPLLGHVVINGGRYALIEEAPAGRTVGPNDEWKHVTFHPIKNRPLGEPRLPHSLLGVTVGNYQQVAEIGRALHEGQDSVFHLFTMGGGRTGVVGIAEVPVSALDATPLRLVAEVRKLARVTRGIAFFAANVPDDRASMFGAAFASGLLVEAVTRRGVSLRNTWLQLGGRVRHDADLGRDGSGTPNLTHPPRET